MDGLPIVTDILEMWERDSQVDMLNLSKEIARNANMHSHYLNLLVRWRVKKIQAKNELEQIEKDTSDWFSGRVSNTSGKFFPFKLTSEDIKIHKKANDDYQNKYNKYESADITVDVLIRILDQIKQRSFDLRGIADIRKFESGAG